MKIIAFCGQGVGTSAILQVNAERVLAKLGIDAQVTAAGVDTIAREAEDAQVILAAEELVPHIGKTYADIVVIQNYFDLEELAEKLQKALG